MNDVEKYEAIEALFEKAIRPALVSDGGDIELDLVKGNDVVISFRGACGHCPSSAGATLAGIERAIQQNVFKEAVVIPTNAYGMKDSEKLYGRFVPRTYVTDEGQEIIDRLKVEKKDRKLRLKEQMKAEKAARQAAVERESELVPA
jgi:Fe-S cluster biogenesis protein NfuA